MRTSHADATADRIPEIDALRAVAVLAVVLYHLDPRWSPGGFAGVDVFFVISGYVVTRALAGHVGEAWGAFLAGFYARRVRRIVPALFACIGTVLVFDTLFVPQAWLSSQNFNTARTALVGLSNVFLESHRETYFSPRIEFNPYAHTWSLGVEEQFYVVLPLVYFAARRWRGGASPASARSWIAVLCVVSFAWSAVASAYAPADAYYALASRFWELGIGAWLAERHRTRGALVVTRSARTSTALRATWVVVLGLGLWVPQRIGFPVPWGLPAVAASALFIDSLQSADAARRRWLRVPLVLYLGRISYSIYLWHWPVFSLVRWTVGLDGGTARTAALVLVALLSMGSYHGVERVFQRRGRRMPDRAAIAIAALGAVVAVLAASALHDRAGRLSLSVTRDARVWYPENWSSAVDGTGCRGVQRQEIVRGEALITIRRTDCADARPVRTLFVLGDSHATAYLTLLGKLVDEHPVNVELRARTGCAFFTLQEPLREAPAGCEEFIEATLRGVERDAAPRDVVFFPSLRLARFADQWGGLDERKARTAGETEVSRRQAIAEVVDRLRRLSTAGVDVVIEAPKPLFAAPPFRCADWFNRDNPVCKPGFTMDAAFLRGYREPVMRQLATLERDLPGTRVWDPFDVLCAGSRCSAFEGGTPLFYDADHLSAFGAEKLYPSFVSFFGFGPPVRSD